MLSVLGTVAEAILLSFLQTKHNDGGHLKVSFKRKSKNTQNFGSNMHCLVCSLKQNKSLKIFYSVFKITLHVSWIAQI